MTRLLLRGPALDLALAAAGAAAAFASALVTGRSGQVDLLALLLLPAAGCGAAA